MKPAGTSPGAELVPFFAPLADLCHALDQLPVGIQDLYPNGAFSEPFDKAGFNPALYGISGEGEQQTEAQEIRENPGGEEKRAPYEDRQSVHEFATGDFTRRQSALNGRNHPEPLTPGQRRAENARRHHQRHRGPGPDSRPDLEKEQELQQGQGDEEEKQSAQRGTP